MEVECESVEEPTTVLGGSRHQGTIEARECRYRAELQVLPNREPAGAAKQGPSQVASELCLLSDLHRRSGPQHCGDEGVAEGLPS